MLEKLFSLLLHAKGGALATVLVIGASGALVTATVENGMTTVTITQPSTTTTGSETTTPAGSTTTSTNTTSNNTVTQSILALFNRTKDEDDPTSTATGNGCSDAAHAMNAAIKLVNDGFKKDHEAVQTLSKNARTDAAKKLVKDANKTLNETRQAAVKAIHALLSPSVACDKDDEDKDEDKDEDNDDDDNDSPKDSTAGATTGTTGPSVAFSGDDAKAIADLAISAMDLQVKNLKTALDALPVAAPKAKDKHDNDKRDNDKHDNKGKGHSEGRSHDSEDDD